MPALLSRSRTARGDYTEQTQNLDLQLPDVNQLQIFDMQRAPTSDGEVGNSDPPDDWFSPL